LPAIKVKRSSDFGGGGCRATSEFVEYPRFTQGEGTAIEVRIEQAEPVCISPIEAPQGRNILCMLVLRHRRIPLLIESTLQNVDSINNCKLCQLLVG
tara:strand:+ start:471 stop:761 length:291 start_codon:yes stop_codon:yes gene_type:complete